jgi:hypothetical protein
LERPRTFSEKIQFRKLYDKDPRLPLLADKIEAKRYVAEAAGAELLVPTIWCGKAMPARADRRWQIPYVIKASHGSGWNVFVTSVEREDWRKIEAKARSWLTRRYGAYTSEWLYGRIRPRLIVEPYIGCGDELPIDYKIFVFDGRAHYIQVITQRAVKMHISMYDRSWVRQPVSHRGYSIDRVPPPRTLERMLDIAERLGRGLPFVRVDLYEVDRRPIFGEMTFYPASGYYPFEPESFDELLGDLWPSASPARPATSELAAFV